MKNSFKILLLSIVIYSNNINASLDASKVHDDCIAQMFKIRNKRDSCFALCNRLEGITKEQAEQIKNWLVWADKQFEKMEQSVKALSPNDEKSDDLKKISLLTLTFNRLALRPLADALGKANPESKES